MTWWMWALVAVFMINAVIDLRRSILFVQDGTDRVKAGAPCSHGCCKVATAENTYCWQRNGDGAFYLLGKLITSPFRLMRAVAKKALFPRGLKSQFAKDQEAKQKAAWLEAEMRRLDQEVRSWNPGALLDPPVLALEAAAAEFNEAARLIADAAGTAWVEPPCVVTLSK